MKKYRTYTAKKYKIARRIVFYAVVAALIFGATVLLGNHLKNKIETADTSEPLDLTTTESVKNEDKEEKPDSVSHDKALADVSAGYLSLSGITEPSEARDAVSRLKSAGYNAACLWVTDGEGALTYASPAVIESSRLPAGEGLIPYEVVKAAAEQADSLGLRLSFMINASESTTDELVCKELFALGFREVIVFGFEDCIYLTNDYVAGIRSYVERLSLATDKKAEISVVFSPELYKAPQNAPYIEKLYAFLNFLSIDMTELSAEECSSAAKDLQGSFTAYLLRPVLSGSDTDSAEAVDKALTEAAVKARQYVTAPKEAAPEDPKDD